LAKLEQDVNIFGILEEVLETDDVIMMKAAMNLDFRHELLLCARLRERSLCNNLGGRHSLSLKVCEFVALGKTSFSEELSP
jgi:hypothetical protein